LTARYQLTHETNQNSGLTQFSLPSQAYNLNETEHTLQISDSQILSPKIVNETRFQFQRETNHQLPLSAATAVQVQGFFSNGGNTQGQVRSTQNNYELQNYTSISHGNHLIKFGGRLRVLTIANSSNPNFNGTFIFSPVFSNTGQLLATALQTYESASASAQNCSSSNYVAASCPSQFSITAGVPMVSVNWFDAGLYAEDEWRVRPNLSLTYGLRFESQNNIHDHADFAPRLGIAWGVGSDGRSAPKTVVRAGFGIFYDRFGQNLVQQAERLNGITQQSIVVRNPEFYSTVPSFSQLQALSNAAPTVYQISPNLRAPYTIQSAASIERQITKAATLSLTYLNSRGEHALYIRNVSAPGAYPVFPQYANENVYQYQSEGVFRQNQFIANVRVSAGKKLSLFGFYTLSYANSNVSAGGGGGGFFGSGTTSSASFLSDQNDPMADYGRAAFDVRHRAFIGGNISLPHSFSLSPFIIINSGQPYNITTGTDLNGDSIFNDRPALASATPCPTYTRVANSTDICTPLGTFNTVPAGQAILPINYGTGPGNATFNLRLSKTIGFGPEAKGASAGRDGGSGGGPRGGGLPGGGLGGRGLSGAGGANPFGFGGTTNRRYNLTFSVSARNLLNGANPGAPVGNLSSQLFAQSISIAGGPFSSASANRRVDLQVMFSF
jgi:hypothetical protein